MKLNKIKIALTLFFLAIFIQPACPSGYYQSGIKYFYSKDYNNALINFKKAVDLYPSDVNSRYFLAQTLVYQMKLKEAQKEYEKIIQTSPSSKAAKLSYTGILKIQDFINSDTNYNQQNPDDDKNRLRALLMEGIGDNYIQNCVSKGKVKRWGLPQKPIKLYISNGAGVKGYKPEFAQLCKKALDQWMTAIGGGASYKITNDKDYANIIVSFTTSLYAQEGNESKKSFVSGLSTPYFQGNQYKFDEVKLTTMRPNGDPYTQDEFVSTVVHEMGHALGINGHSDDPKDIMYPVSDGKNIRTTLSTKDISTIKLLYRLDADISNFDDEYIVQNTGKNDIILGGNYNRLNNKLIEALAYVKKVPSHPLSWTSLGSAYYALNKYYDAMSSYEKALKLDPKFDQARAGIAACYSAMGDNVNAILQYETIVADNKTDITYNSNLAALYWKVGKYNEAKNVIKNLIVKNPAAMDDDRVKDIILKAQGTL